MEKSMLFSPLKLKNITLPGRIVRSATEYFCSYPDGHVHPCEFEVYERLGQQPLGMIISAHTCVAPEGRSNIWQNALWGDEFIEETKKIADAAQATGAPAIMQIGHGGMKGEGNNGGLKVLTPDNMSHEEIRMVVRSFADAAVRAKKAGMKGVMLHCAHGYLLSQFFYPAYNHRADEYGGDAEGRFRIVYEIIDAVKESCGEDYPLFIKINVTDPNESEEYYNDVVAALSRTENILDAVETSGWSAIRRGVPEKPYFIDVVRRLKGDVGVPLIEVGGFRNAQSMLSALEAGACAVSISRPLLCEPDFPTRLRDFDGVESKCVGCGMCGKPLDMETLIRCPIAGI